MIVYRHVSAAANTGFCGGERSGLLSTTKTFSLFMRFGGPLKREEEFPDHKDPPPPPLQTEPVPPFYTRVDQSTI